MLSYAIRLQLEIPPTRTLGQRLPSHFGWYQIILTGQLVAAVHVYNNSVHLQLWPYDTTKMCISISISGPLLGDSSLSFLSCTSKSTSSSTEGGSEPNLLLREHKVVSDPVGRCKPCDAGMTWLSSPVCLLTRYTPSVHLSVCPMPVPFTECGDIPENLWYHKVIF